MFIQRIQIEEGFLDGLDVELTAGLNVLIGARGTGKTSLIELIKFCLGVKGQTMETSKRSHDHALSVLGGGQITVTITDGEREVLVSRTASDPAPRSTSFFVPPLVFSQTEIENVGLQASGRLNLLSSFVEGSSNFSTEADLIAESRSLTVQARGIQRELDELQQRVDQIPIIEAELQKLAPEENQLSELSVEASRRKAELDRLSEDISSNSVATVVLQRFTSGIINWRSSIERVLQGRPNSERWPETNGPDPLAAMIPKLSLVQDALQKALSELASIESQTIALSESRLSARLNSEERARQLRRELDALQAGAGNIARQGQQLRERKAQLEAIREILLQKTEGLRTLLTARGSVLDKIDALRATRYNTRAQIAQNLNQVLAPRVRIDVSRAGQFEQFAAAIAEALKGSGLRYGDLAPALATRVSPRELLEAVEDYDIDFISETAGISSERATRLLAHLRESDLGVLSTTGVEDLVEFQLLDGSNYKDISELSTGQRCTVVLPIILRHTARILIIDQPEDHIDNAFIADTLIQAVLARDPNSQILFSSHNANIPVLGDANQVVQLGSDGRRGFVITASGLETPEVVGAITAVMEGGISAFEKRSAFYARYNLK